MTRFPKRPLLTHAGALVAGLLLASFAPGFIATLGLGNRNAAQATPDTVDRDSSLSSLDRAGKSRQPRPASASTSQAVRNREFLTAWNLLKRQPMPAEDRGVRYQELLKQWADADLAAAMKFAATEGQSLSAFATAFSQHPLEAWKILSSGSLGPYAARLNRQWLEVVVTHDPKLVMSVFGELPANLRLSAMSRVFHTGNNNSMRQTVLDGIRASGDSQQVATWLQSAYRMMDAPEDREVLRAQWGTLPPGSPERTAAMAGWATLLRGMDAAGISAQFASIPESERGEAAKMLLSETARDVPALLPALDQAMAAGEWDFIDQSTSGKVYNTGRPQELADWALNLPERPETENLFSSMVSPLATMQPDDARAMLDQLPEGDWRREQGLGELSVQKLYSTSDLDAFMASTAGLTNPGVVRRLERVRYDYMNQTGRRISH
ncbi:MAG: hypothetical protein JWO82_1105 [Akkermansiaceae bacterium]|nr:hypothetical protein [Akkermansiaceae bacterium]